jgi:queuine tRNA-ribosyltransferase
MLTPETSVDAQKALGADIIIPLDILPPYHTHPSQLEISVDRTHRWEERSLARHLESPASQAMYAVIHGGLDRDLRRRSVDFLSALPFDGWAIGGSLGRHRADMLGELVLFFGFVVVLEKGGLGGQVVGETGRVVPFQCGAGWA